MACRNPNLNYDTKGAELLFGNSKRIIEGERGDLWVVYSHTPSTQLTPKERAELRGLDADPHKNSGSESPITLVTECVLQYHIPGFRSPMEEMLGRFDHTFPDDLALPQTPDEYRAGDIKGEMMIQIALRVERLFRALGPHGRNVDLTLEEGKKTRVTQEYISAMKRFLAGEYGLPEEIALLSDRYPKSIAANAVFEKL